MEQLLQFFSFDGRAGRKTFWVNYIALGIVNIFLSARYVHTYVSFYDLEEHTYVTNKPVYYTAVLLISLRLLSVSVRRWHDIGKSGWFAAMNAAGLILGVELVDLPDSIYWGSILLMAILGLVVLGFQGFVPGDSGPNEYGPAPGSAGWEPETSLLRTPPSRGAKEDWEW